MRGARRYGVTRGRGLASAVTGVAQVAGCPQTVVTTGGGGLVNADADEIARLLDDQADAYQDAAPRYLDTLASRRCEHSPFINDRWTFEWVRARAWRRLARA